MPTTRDERRLTAILAMDVVGYSRMMEADEDTTLARLRWLRQSLVEPHIAGYRGRIFKTMGDGLLVEFGSAADAVGAAVEIQQALATTTLEQVTGEPVRLRIGIHVGDVISDGADLLGDGVNVAARLESIAEPGGIYVSRGVRDSARRAAQFDFEDLGERQVKNISRPIQVFRVVAVGIAAGVVEGASADESRRKRRSRVGPAAAAAIVVLALAGAGGTAWRHGWFDLRPARPAPWSAADMRQTFTILPSLAPGDDAILSGYADGFVEALSALFTPNFGSERLVPSTGGAGRAHFVIELKVRRASAAAATATVTLTDAATHDQLLSRTLTEPLGEPLDAQRGEVMRLGNDLKWAAIEREQAASEATPAELRDARDLIILSKFARQTDAGIKRRVALVQQAGRLAPTDPNVLVETATILSWGKINGLSADVGAELDQARAAAEQVLDRTPNQLAALRALASVYVEQARHEDVIAATDRMLAVSHNNGWALGEQCYAELSLGRDVEAAASLERALQFEDTNTGFFIAGLAIIVRFDQARYAEAATWARKALQLLPAGEFSDYDRAGWRLYLASAEALDGKAGPAAQTLTEFQALKPDIHGIGDLLRSDLIAFPLIARPRLIEGLRKAGMKE